MLIKTVRGKKKVLMKTEREKKEGAHEDRERREKKRRVSVAL